VIYRITRILKVNVVVEPVKGGRPIKGKPDLFVLAPADAAPPVRWHQQSDWSA
jgi:hypothetical protein